MNKTINKPGINEWLHRFEAGQPFYILDSKLSLDPYIYNDAINDFVKYAYENDWVCSDYQNISHAWKQATDKIAFIMQLNQVDVFRVIT